MQHSRSGADAYGEMEQGNAPVPPQQENPQQKVAHKRMQETKAQVDEVSIIPWIHVVVFLRNETPQFIHIANETAQWL